jgi:hypothetical protein
MSIFNKYSKLHGLPLPGQKITFKAPAAWGYFTNVIEDEKTLLVPGQEYTVKKTSLNSSSTYVYLEEYWIEGLDEYRNNQKMFTMQSFSWEKPEIVLDELLGFSVRDLSTLQRVYGYGLYVDDAVWLDGSPMLHIFHESDIVTAVKMMP